MRGWGGTAGSRFCLPGVGSLPQLTPGTQLEQLGRRHGRPGCLQRRAGAADKAGAGGPGLHQVGRAFRSGSTWAASVWLHLGFRWRWPPYPGD